MGKITTSKLSAEKRANELLKKLSFQEKLGQLVGYNPANWSNDVLEKDYPFGAGQVSLLVGTEKASISDVGELQIAIQKKIMDLSPHRIPALFHVETLTGLKLPEATSFPSGIGQGASFNPTLLGKIGESIGEQANAVGASLAFSPVLDISRDSRFGRQGETFGEDPSLVSAMGTALVKGIQKNNNVGSVAKHFLGYQNAEGGIHAATCDAPERLLREVYAKPFQSAITIGKLKGIMPCYSSINYEPVSGSKLILTDLLREKMGFEGVTVSDYCAVQEIYERQRVEDSYSNAGRRALQAGIDQELPSKMCYSYENFKQWAQDEQFIQLLNDAVFRVLTLKYELGLFENPFAKSTEEIKKIFSETRHKEISLKSAKESFVLLKNNGVLPLKRKKQTIALIGCHADSIRSLYGGYSYMSTIEKRFGVKNTMAGVLKNEKETQSTNSIETYPGSYVEKEHPKVESYARSIAKNTGSLYSQLEKEYSDIKVLYSYGYPYVGKDTTHYEDALEVAKQSDIIILTVGGKYGTGSTASIGEGIDATNINLPECQERFIEKVAEMNKPLILLHFGGRPISSDAADLHGDAILEVWNPGEHGSEAIVKTLFGDYNPGGKMPVTTARTAGQIPIYYNHLNGSSYHQNTNGAFKGYVDCSHKPRYYFGQGMSYTKFDYKDLKVKSNSEADDEIQVSVNVSNIGNFNGEEVVQLYAKDCYASMVRPHKELIGFYRVAIKVKHTKKIIFTVKKSQLAFLDTDMRWKVEAGQIEFQVGSSSHEIHLRENFDLPVGTYVEEQNRCFYASVRES